MQTKKAYFIMMRYLVLVAVGVLYPLLSLIILYLTLYPAYFLLNLIYEVSVSGYVLTVSGVEVGIVSACVAGSAYFLLLILNLTTGMNSRKRVCSLFFSLLLLLVVNILRIFFFSILFVEDFVYFDILHKFFWYFMSVLLVVFIWFLTVLVFKIRRIPVYSDLVFLFRNSVNEKNRENPYKK